MSEKKKILLLGDAKSCLITICKVFNVPVTWSMNFQILSETEGEPGVEITLDQLFAIASNNQEDMPPLIYVEECEKQPEIVNQVGTFKRGRSMTHKMKANVSITDILKVESKLFY